MTLRIKKGAEGHTLAELLVSLGVGAIVLLVIAILTSYGYRSFVAMGNYADLDRASRNALDLISREMRQASALVSYTSNSTIRSLTFTNAAAGRQMVLTWTPDSQLLNLNVSGMGNYNLLTECERWDYSLYTQAAALTSTNLVFYPATNSAGVVDVSACKMVNMSWKCSRTILGNRVNTESVQTAQIVLRNKIN